MIGGSISLIDRKPKKPLKEFCTSVLRAIEISYPLEPVGYLWQNKALGLLMRDDSVQQVQAAEKLARSAAIRVDVSASYETGSNRNFYAVTCTR